MTKWSSDGVYQLESFPTGGNEGLATRCAIARWPSTPKQALDAAKKAHKLDDARWWSPKQRLPTLHETDVSISVYVQGREWTHGLRGSRSIPCCAERSRVLDAMAHIMARARSAMNESDPRQLRQLRPGRARQPPTMMTNCPPSSALRADTSNPFRQTRIPAARAQSGSNDPSHRGGRAACASGAGPGCGSSQVAPSPAQGVSRTLEGYDGAGHCRSWCFETRTP